MDWKLCCQYFEDPAGYSLELGLKELPPKMSKTHAKPEWYARRTITKAFERVRGEAVLAAGPAASSSEPAGGVDQQVLQRPANPAHGPPAPCQGGPAEAPRQLDSAAQAHDPRVGGPAVAPGPL